jgi:hypothetical protein
VTTETGGSLDVSVTPPIVTPSREAQMEIPMRHVRFVGLSAVVASLSCSGSSTTTPAPAPAPTPPPAVAPAPTGRGGAPGGGRGGTPEQRAARRDSIAALRAASVAQLMTSIAGKENLPAGQVFRNVRLMKDVPAGRFLVQMDSVFGRSLSRNCTDCHVAGDWASDTLPRKRTARVMIDIVNAINTTELAKLGRARTPQINCVTCHRGGSPTNGVIVP